MKQNKILLLMLMLSTAMVTHAQTDSTKVTNDSVTWNQSLDGVTVTAQRQLIKQDIDRIGYDVQADEDSRTENVLDMLRVTRTTRYIRTGIWIRRSLRTQRRF